VDATGDIGFGGEDDHDIEIGSEAEIELGIAEKQGEFGYFSFFESSLILPGLPLVIASGSKSGKRKRPLTHINNEPLGELDTSIRREFLYHGLSNRAFLIFALGAVRFVTHRRESKRIKLQTSGHVPRMSTISLQMSTHLTDVSQFF
jgi:hypothetical protein